VFFLATRFWETLPRIRRPGVAVAGMAAAYAGAGLALMMLDEGRARITIYNLNVETLPWQAMGAVGLGMALFVVGVAAAFLRPGHTQAAQAPR